MYSADPLNIGVGHGGRGSGASGIGDALGDALVRPGGVVVSLVFGQDAAQMLLAEDQDAVEELAAVGAENPVAYATWAYSRIRPPSRSRRRIRTFAPWAGGKRCPAGGLCCSVRCGRCWL